MADMVNPIGPTSVGANGSRRNSADDDVAVE